MPAPQPHPQGAPVPARNPVVIFTPLPPAKSGIADYSLELLPHLVAACPQRDLVVVAPQAKAHANRPWRTITPDDYQRSPELHSAPTVYQFGNNRDHVFAYNAFLKRPGVVVIHDFNLHYLVEDATLVLGDIAAYRRTLVDEYGEPGGTLADLRQLGYFSESQKLTLSLTGHVLRRATGIIVHSQWVYDRLPPEARARAVVVPHHFAPQALGYQALSRDEARSRLGLEQDTFTVLALGYITPPKQVQATLAALGMLKKRGLKFKFLIGGERNPSFDIDAHIRQHDLVAETTITGFLKEDDFFHCIRASDLLVNLRYPTVGESSGTLARALALGLPAVVHNFGPAAEYPEGVVRKVPLEPGTPYVLAETIEALIQQPQARQNLSQRACAHMQQHCSVATSAQQYAQMFDRLFPLAAPVPAPAAALAPAAPGA
ncbi:MAG: glycosyltransferase [Ideonella sp.]|nr:glycosyltransferase [Ideonella sp.]